MVKTIRCLLFKKKVPQLNEVYKLSEGEIHWSGPIAIMFIIFLAVLAQFNLI